MSEPGIRPAEIAAAAMVIGGGLIMVWPQQGLSLLRLVIATIAAAAALYAFAVLASPAWWASPFEPQPRRRRRPQSPDDLDWIRAMLGGRRQPIAGGPPLPPGTLRFLQPLIRSALEREGVNPEDSGRDLTVAVAPSPLTRAVLAAEPLRHASWLGTRRSDTRGVAAVVHQVLDDLDRIRAGRRGTQHDTPTWTPETK